MQRPPIITAALAAGWNYTSLSAALEINPSTLHRWTQRGITTVGALAITHLLLTDHREAPIDRGARTYFVSDGQYIKIGRARDVKKRLVGLRVASSRPLTLLGVSHEPEQEIQARFAAHRVRGEWFEAVPELLAYIGSLPK